MNRRAWAGRDLDRERLEQTESAAGGRFEITLRNPGKTQVAYSLNGRPQFALLAEKQVAHRGVGKAEVRFDHGLGDGSSFAYDLPNGKAYTFKWGATDLPEVGRVHMLNVYKG